MDAWHARDVYRCPPQADSIDIPAYWRSCMMRRISILHDNTECCADRPVDAPRGSPVLAVHTHVVSLHSGVVWYAQLWCCCLRRRHGPCVGRWWVWWETETDDKNSSKKWSSPTTNCGLTVYVSVCLSVRLYDCLYVLTWLDLTWFIPRPREHIGPHSHAILVCWELPPPPLPRWVPSSQTFLDYASLVCPWPTGFPLETWDWWSICIFYHWGCSVCVVVQSWP